MDDHNQNSAHSHNDITENVGSCNIGCSEKSENEGLIQGHMKAVSFQGGSVVKFIPPQRKNTKRAKNVKHHYERPMSYSYGRVRR